MRKNCDAYRCDSLKIFNKICKIARPSGKEGKMVAFLVEFAKKYNLEYKLCGVNNIIIYKKSTSNKSDKTLILQSHIDMVCEKEIDTKIDFLNDCIKTKTDGDFISAQGTTLGADNGFGVAIILHILKSKNLKHCNLECVFTSQEETTMLGAKTLDYNLIKGKSLLSLDGSYEHKIDTASAAMVTIKLSKNIEPILLNSKCDKLTISGLIGGHSGEDIDKNRLNAIKLILDLINDKKEFEITNIDGGDKANAIPHTCSVVLKNRLGNDGIDTVSHMLYQYKKQNNNIDINFHNKITKMRYGINMANNKELIDLLNTLPHGVLKKEKNVVITSCNLAKVKTKKDKIEIILSVRSSDEKLEIEAVENIKNLAKQFDYKFKILNKAPGFEENKNSYITKLCQKTYKNLFNKNIEASPIHAGLEGGVFKQHIKDLDLCVIGCDIFDLHSTKERASITSLQRVEKWTEKIVEEF